MSSEREAVARRPRTYASGPALEYTAILSISSAAFELIGAVSDAG